MARESPVFRGTQVGITRLGICNSFHNDRLTVVSFKKCIVLMRKQRVNSCYFYLSVGNNECVGNASGDEKGGRKMNAEDLT